MTVKKDLYKVLDIKEDATEDDIKKAYYGLAKKYHPDKNEASDAEEKFKEIGAAYETLKDDGKRREYDSERKGESERARMRAQNAKTFFNGSSNGFGRNGTSFNFRNMFNEEGDDFFNRFRGDFGNFGNDEKTSAGEGKNKSRKRTKQRRTNDSTRPEWDSNWNENSNPEDNIKSSSFKFEFFKGNPKHAFSSFGKTGIFTDGNDSFFENPSPFSDFDKVFEEFFNDPFFAAPRPFFKDVFRFNVNGNQEERPKRQSTFYASNEDPGKTNADQSGETGSTRNKPHMQDDMYNWSKPLFGEDKEDSDLSKGKENKKDAGFDSEEDIDLIRLACSYCGRKFIPSRLTKHEDVCRRFHLRGAARSMSPPTTGGPKKSTATSGSSPAHKQGASTNHSSNAAPHPTKQETSGSTKSSFSSPKYEGETASSRHKVPRDRPTHPAENIDYVTCPWCSRLFSPEAVQRHTPYCLERNKKTHDTSRASTNYKPGPSTNHKPGPSTSSGAHTSRDYTSRDYTGEYSRYPPRSSSTSRADRPTTAPGRAARPRLASAVTTHAPAVPGPPRHAPARPAA